ncbi:MAG: hypothetical protein FD149_320 [Rhodospirillaceae bacterium]|nr:MAG: hypothetical protein FD149_320 [Rhodospirillaceae bacterium]
MTDDSAPVVSFGTRHWPVELRLKKAEKMLEIDFDDGRTFTLSAELLRVESPSAEVQGHGPDEKKTPGGCRTVGITAIQPIGNYAIAIVFDDMHDTGIYSWDYLYTLGDNQEDRWRDYIGDLARLGLSRDQKPT